MARTPSRILLAGPVSPLFAKNVPPAHFLNAQVSAAASVCAERCPVGTSAPPGFKPLNKSKCLIHKG